MGGQDTKRLLCIWHVDKNWRKHSNTIKDQTVKAIVYKKLTLIRMQPNPNICEIMMKDFLGEYLKKTCTLTVAEYFKTNYCSKLEY